MVWWWLLAAALAGSEPEVASTASPEEQRLQRPSRSPEDGSRASAGDAVGGGVPWSLGAQAWWVEDPVRVSQRTGELELQGGYVFTVEEEGEVLGVAFVGSAEWTLRFESRRDGRVFANARVLRQGDAAEGLAEVAQGAPWVTGVDRGLVLGLDVWDALLPALIPVTEEKGALLRKREDGLEELLVTSHGSLAAARRTAAGDLRERVARWRESVQDPAGWIGLDRIAGCPAEGCNRWADLRTEVKWDRFAGADHVGAGNRWLGWVVDLRGLYDRRFAEQVVALGIDSWGSPRVRTATVARFPMEAGLYRAPQRVDLREARVTHTVRAEGGQRLDQETAAELVVEAVGGEARAVVIDVPHVGQQPFMKMHELPNGFELLGFEGADGRPLPHAHVPLFGDQRPGRGSVRTYLVSLSEPLGAGAQTTVRVRYRDHHRYGRYKETEGRNPETGLPMYFIESLGTAAAIDGRPRVRGHHGGPVTTSLVVRQPADQGRKQRVALSGQDARRWTEGEVTVTEATVLHDAARVVVGPFALHHEPGGESWPAITAAVQPGHRGAAERMPSLVRRAVAFNASLLHPLPIGQFTIAELAASSRGNRLYPSGELVAFETHVAGYHKSLSVDSALAMAAAVHHQWWIPVGGLDVGSTLPDRVGAAYGLLFLDRAARARDVQELRDAAHRRAEVGQLPVTGGGNELIGAVVLADTLRQEVGEAVFFGAVHRLVQGYAPPTWEGLQVVMEELAGRSLEDWFDVWVHGGHAPRVALRWSHDGQTFRGQLRSDLPFGRFTVPVRVAGEIHPVEIVDGVGALVVPVRRRPRPAVDPDRQMLLAGRRVVRGEVEAVP